jgi:hypothetical protein
VIAAPPVAIAVSPARLVVAAGETRELHVANRGGTAAVVEVTTAGYTHALRGRIVILPRRSAAAARPQRLVVPARGSATVTVSGRRSPPGDHPSLVLLTTQRGAADIAVRVRVGVLVLVRGAGRIVHRVALDRIEVRGRVIGLWLRNLGNAAEPLRIRVLVGRTLLRDSRQLLPHARALAELRLRTTVHGRFRIRVEVAYGASILRRTARIRA